MTEITLETRRTWSAVYYPRYDVEEARAEPGLATICRRMRKMGQRLEKSVSNGDGSYTMTFVDKDTGL